jgi:hypothetical protein
VGEFVQTGEGTADMSLAAETLSPDERAAERKAYLEEVARIRRIRKPFGAYSQKLALPRRPGYHRHWFNDVGGRLEDAVGNGWAHVKGQDGKPIKRVVGTGRDNGALVGYAMEIPLEFWQEDMDARFAAAQARVDDVKKTPFQSPNGSKADRADQDKFYTSRESVISMSESTSKS